MISAGDFRNGVTIEIEGNVCQIVEFQHVKPGKGAAFVRTKYKNIITGAVLEKSFRPTEKFPQARIDRVDMSYLYNDGELYNFMNTETYDQIEIPEERVEWEKNFLKPSEMINIQVFEGEILGVILPDKVSLKITECEQAVKGDTATSAQKNAVVETGLQVKVPLFIQEGETIVVSTADGKYCSRAKD